MPHAFATEEELLRTVIHEGRHVKQFKKCGREYTRQKSSLIIDSIDKDGNVKSMKEEIFLCRKFSA